MNSFVVDSWLNRAIIKHLLLFYVLSLPVPRLTAPDSAFAPIGDWAAGLICTTPQFDGLVKEMVLKSHRQGVSDAAKRAQLGAELDSLIAHLYGLSEAEFAHVLSTIPLVPAPVKTAALAAYRDAEPGLIR